MMIMIRYYPKQKDSSLPEFSENMLSQGVLKIGHWATKIQKGHTSFIAWLLIKDARDGFFVFWARTLEDLCHLVFMLRSVTGLPHQMVYTRTFNKYAKPKKDVGKKM